MIDVSRETREKLERYVWLLKDESSRQNLVAASTLPDLWERHIEDSLQLLTFASLNARRWVDIGSGAGLPGLVLACAGIEIDLVEPRRLRSDFLAKVVDELGLSKVRVFQTRVERFMPKQVYGVITARALAPLNRLLSSSIHLSSQETIWILPKGQSARAELEGLGDLWQGEFRIEASRTDQSASVIVARNVSREKSA